MAALTDIRLVDAIVLVGPAFELVQGYGEDKFSIGLAGDIGSAISGVDGDITFVGRVQNLWNISYTFTTGALGIGLLSRLTTTLGVMPIKITYGQWTLVGHQKMINMGEMSASLGNNTRTMTGAVAKISGFTDTQPGTVIAVF